MDFPCSSREELLELDMLGKRLHGISSIKVYSPDFHAISCVSKMDVQHVGALTKTISSKLDQCQVILEEYEALLATHKRLMAERCVLLPTSMLMYQRVDLTCCHELELGVSDAGPRGARCVAGNSTEQATKQHRTYQVRQSSTSISCLYSPCLLT